MDTLGGKTFIITGATSGMGAATAELFAKSGAQLILSGRNKEKGSILLAEIRLENPETHMHYGDISQEATNQDLVKLALQKFGGLDGIICHAGILGLGSVTEVNLETWHHTMETNLYAPFYLARHALPELQKSKDGLVILNASIAANKSFPNHPAYCASKAGLVALGRQMALDYAPKVRVNVINPGPVDTPMIWASAKAFPNPAEAVEAAGANTPLQRLGKPEEVAKLCLFLASDQSSWMTGSVVTIDGGAMV